LNLIITPPLQAERDFKNISTIGSAQITLKPNQTIIKLKISGEGNNQSELNYQFRQEIKKIANKLEEYFSNQLTINTGDIKIASYFEKNNHFDKKIYKGISYLELSIDDHPIENIDKLIDTIKDLNPASKKVSYNQPYDFSYELSKAYYNFKDPLKQEKKLLEKAINNSKAKLDSLLKLSSLKLVGIYQLKEIIPSKLSIYQEEINIDNVKEATEKQFKTELRVIYQVN